MLETAYILNGWSAAQRVTVTDRDRDGFVWVRVDAPGRAHDRETLRLTPSEVFATPYLAGRATPRTGDRLWRQVDDAASAALAWKDAQDNHEHTSWYGAERIREYRAFWLGRLRSARERWAREIAGVRP